jgi:aminopeptidase N
MRVCTLVLCLLASATGTLPAQNTTSDSGGLLPPEQAAIDVRYYDLHVAVDPAGQRIDGTLLVDADVVHPVDGVILDLDDRLAVAEVRGLVPGRLEGPLAFERRSGQVWVPLRATFQPGDRVRLEIDYGGQPKSGPAGSFSAFIWGVTPDDQPWVTVNCERFGADLWWPVKDHPSDEPDSMAVRVTVPADLTAVSNGVLRDVTTEGDGRTFHWFSAEPLNLYNVTLNVAPYVELVSSFESVSGATVPVYFWVLEADREPAAAALPEFLDHIRHLESVVGPYPFQSEKYGLAQTNYLGMEHQTVISYGAGFRDDAMAGLDWGFDALHQHELAHEWFGNMVSPLDFRDLWLNEGFAQYAQILYAESRLGTDKADELLRLFRERLDHSQAIAPRHAVTAGDAFGRDLYWKGAWVLHTLRSLIGDEDFFTVLRRWTYAAPEDEDVSGGCACRYASTEEFVTLAETVAGRSLDWFFETYVRQPGVPKLRIWRAGDFVHLTWVGHTPPPYPIPIEISVDGEARVVEVTAGETTLSVPAEAVLEADPRGRMLFETVVVP